MAENAQRWIDAPEFHWVPERPFRVEPEFSGAPLPANDDPDEAPKPRVRATQIAKAAFRTPGYFLSRLVIGLAQGVGLLLLSAGHGDTAMSAALYLVLLFAPLLLLTGLGRVPGKLLLPWVLFAGITLAALGVYQHWRAPQQSGLLVMVGIFLFIGQAMIMAWARNGRPLARYIDYHDSAWPLALQLLLCAVAAAGSFVAAGAGFALLRQSYPAAHPAFLILPIVTLAVAVMSWLAMAPLLRLLQRGAQGFLTLALAPVILLAAAAGVAGLLMHWHPPLLLCLILGYALLLCLNASYRDGAARPRWREILEFAAAFALTPPIILGAHALAARVTQQGWTGPRILAMAALGVLVGYAFFYVTSALVALGGGRWMQRIERANWMLAILMLGLLAALLSPIADPARLAVASQMQRLQTGQVDPDDFDFAWLNSGGGRFGHKALEEMVGRKASPDQARGAFLALAAGPDSARPAPTEIGANIEVRSSNGRLPSALLARDWSQVTTPGVPPCLVKAALSCDAYFVDLDGDGRDEIVLVYGNAHAWWAGVMKEDAAGRWNVAGTLAAPPCSGSFDALRAGRFAPVAPLPGWQDLLVGGTRLVVSLTGAKPVACS